MARKIAHGTRNARVSRGDVASIRRMPRSAPAWRSPIRCPATPSPAPASASARTTARRWCCRGLSGAPVRELIAAAPACSRTSWSRIAGVAAGRAGAAPRRERSGRGAGRLRRLRDGDDGRRDADGGEQAPARHRRRHGGLRRADGRLAHRRARHRLLRVHAQPRRGRASIRRSACSRRAPCSSSAWKALDGTGATLAWPLVRALGGAAHAMSSTARTRADRPAPARRRLPDAGALSESPAECRAASADAGCGARRSAAAARPPARRAAAGSSVSGGCGRCLLHRRHAGQGAGGRRRRRRQLEREARSRRWPGRGRRCAAPPNAAAGRRRHARRRETAAPACRRPRSARCRSLAARWPAERPRRRAGIDSTLRARRRPRRRPGQLPSSRDRSPRAGSESPTGKV